MPRTEVDRDASGQSGIRHSFVQLKEMGMSAPNADPNDLWSACPRKAANTLQWQEEGAKLNRPKIPLQFLLFLDADSAEKSQREMDLIRSKPANTGDVRIQPDEQLRDRVWKFQTNEKPLRSHRNGSSLVVASDRRIA